MSNATEAVTAAQGNKKADAVKKKQKSNDKGVDAKKAAKVKKGMTPGLAALIVFVSLLLLMLAFGVILFFNLFSMKDNTVAFLQQGFSPYQEQMDSLALKQIDLDEWEIELNTKEDELLRKESDFIEKENDYKAREERLKTWDEELVELEEMLGGKRTTLKEVVNLLEKMNDVAAAARIIEGMSSIDNQMAILLNMKPATASQILKSMNATVSAQLIANMMEVRTETQTDTQTDTAE